MYATGYKWWSDRTLALQPVDVHLGGVDVVHEQLIAILVREIIAQVTHGAGKGGGKVFVGADRFDIDVIVRIKMPTGLPFVMAALNHVIQMRNHAGGHKRLTVIIEIHTPLVGTAFGKTLEEVLSRVIAPDGCVDREAILIRGAGFTDLRFGEHTLAAVKPTVGTPDK